MQAYALTTLTRLKSKLGITDASQNEELEALIESQSERFTGELCRGHLHYEQAYQEVVEADSLATELKLSKAPILSITTVEIMASDGSFSEMDINTWVDGRWLAQAGAWARPHQHLVHLSARYRITYAAGWVTPQQAADDNSLVRTLPRDIEDAVLELCLYEHALSDPTVINVKSRKMLSTSKSYDVRHMTDYRAGKLPPKARAAVRKYKWVV